MNRRHKSHIQNIILLIAAQAVICFSLVSNDGKRSLLHASRVSVSGGRTSHFVVRQPNDFFENIRIASEAKKYNDSLLDKIMISALSSKMAAAVEEKSNLNASYDDIVRYSFEIQFRYPDAKTQKSVIYKLLTDSVPPWVARLYQQLMIPGKLTSELNAYLCMFFSAWLVGPMTVEKTEIKTNGNSEIWNSKVKIERCRYLESSMCKRTCVNLCKSPTEKFFMEYFGFPLRIEPDFDDLSCAFTFGKLAKPSEDDNLLNEPCFYNCPARISSNLNDDKMCID